MNEEQTKTVAGVRTVLAAQLELVKGVYQELGAEIEDSETVEADVDELENQVATLEELEDHIELAIDDCSALL